jgi:hypothetical protein
VVGRHSYVPNNIPDDDGGGQKQKVELANRAFDPGLSRTVRVHYTTQAHVVTANSTVSCSWNDSVS